MERPESSIAARVAEVRRRIEAAAARAGRRPAAVALMAAVKTRSAGEVAAAIESGIALIGENRVQEGLDHLAALPAALRARCKIHFIGRLQANKVRKALLAFDSLDSVDSSDLALRLQRVAAEEGLTREVLLEVNLAGEGQKGGVAPEDANALALLVRECPNLRLAGVMAVPPFEEDPEASRPHFRRLKKMFEALSAGRPDPIFRHISMGMTHDLEVAVEEGATLVRVGTAIFGERK